MPLRLLTIACLLSCFAPSLAAPTPKAQREIQGLLDALSASSCEFQRNGTWHGRDEARKHLQRKYDYLIKSDLADTAYQVRCPGQPVQPAAAWFKARLDALRGSGAPGR